MKSVSSPNRTVTRRIGLGILALSLTAGAAAPAPAPQFRILAFYTAKDDAAHISFAEEANRWFPSVAGENHFAYSATTNWNELNAASLAQCQVVIFLDSRPDGPDQRSAFRNFMEHGGGWMGFHFAGFALTPSRYPQDWDWYHNQFLGSGEYDGNTWKPTAAVLRVENHNHPATRHLPATFTSSPNEWYRWKKDLRTNNDIEILLAIDPASFPLGTGPKPHEIWHEGDYPVVWANRRYRMIYLNMGHNDVDYSDGLKRTASYTFTNEVQNQLILDGLRWVGTRP